LPEGGFGFLGGGGGHGEGLMRGGKNQKKISFGGRKERRGGGELLDVERVELTTLHFPSLFPSHFYLL